MKVIYETTGKAREYAPLAASLYRGCEYGCVYCYAPLALHMHRDVFHDSPKPRRENILEDFIRDCNDLEEVNDCRPILLSFSCDPYQPIDDELQLTRKAIKAMVDRDLEFRILTKGGMRSYRDFDLMQKGRCEYGATLVFCKDAHAKVFEPNAPPTSERIQSLWEAHQLGIRTWVSLEPAWTLTDVTALITRTHEFVDRYWIGKLNYHPQAKNVGWMKFAHDVVEFCELIGVKYTLKDDLKKLLEVSP